MAIKTVAEALRKALREEMQRDKHVILIGEDIGIFGGAYSVSRGLIDEFGEDRVRDTPISEVAIIGAGIGAAMTGLRPVAEIQFVDFMACAMDQIANQAAKLRLMFGGQVSIPIVIRAPYGATGRAAQHSQTLESWFMHIPGLKVVMPSTPYDAKGLLKSAIRDDNPVIFLEHKLLYGSTSPGGKAKTLVSEISNTMTPAPDEEYTIPLGKADIKRAGNDITVVATGVMVHMVLSLATELQRNGLSLEIIDPRTLTPLDKETILNSVRKTGKVIIVHEGYTQCGFGAEVASIIAEEAFDYLDSPVKRVSNIDVPVPFAPLCEEYVLPNRNRILNAIQSICQ